MPYRNADNLPGSHDPALEELHNRKKKWADDGCLPADPMDDLLRSLERDARDGRITVQKGKTILARLEQLPSIPESVAQAIRTILDEAHLCDARQMIMKEMKKMADHDGVLSDKNKDILRKMIEVQMANEELSAPDYQELLEMIGFKVIKG